VQAITKFCFSLLLEEEEGSIEAGHAEEEEIKVLLHSSPIYPLPEAIKKASTDLTTMFLGNFTAIVFNMHSVWDPYCMLPRQAAC